MSIPTNTVSMISQIPPDLPMQDLNYPDFLHPQNIGSTVEVHEIPNQGQGQGQSPEQFQAQHNSSKAKKRTLKTYFTETQSSHNRFTVMTYNIWFDNAYIKERTLKIVNIIKHKSPDIVCLQELTEGTFDLIESQLGSIYQIFQAFKDEGNPYGTCIMCLRESVSIIEDDDNPYYYDYNSCTQMGRRVVGCEIEFKKFKTLKTPRVHILTTHLESLKDNTDQRASQFDIIKTVIKGYKNCILTGDFNVCNSNEPIEKKITESKLTDCWIEMGCPHKIKYTYNAKKNKNIHGSKYLNRFDRILYCSEAFSAKSMTLTGRDDVSASIPIPPSDHYGLITEFEFNED